MPRTGTKKMSKGKKEEKKLLLQLYKENIKLNNQLDELNIQMQIALHSTQNENIKKQLEEFNIKFQTALNEIKI